MIAVNHWTVMAFAWLFASTTVATVSLRIGYRWLALFSVALGGGWMLLLLTLALETT